MTDPSKTLLSSEPERPPPSDPSALATDALMREVAHLRDLLEAQLGALEQKVDVYIADHRAKHAAVKEAQDSRVEDFAHRLAELDRRYQQRYEAQAEAISAAFEAQQEATRTALVSAERAVQTALESADKAVSKAEQLNEKRFQLMNENALVVSELSDRIERVQEKISGLDRVTDAKFVTFRTLVDSQAEKVALALAASDKAVSKAEVANEKRFEGVNEFRGQLADQARDLMPRSEALQVTSSLSARMDASVKGLEMVITDLKSRVDRQEGKSGGYSSSWGIMVAAVGLIGTVIAIVIALGVLH